MLTRGEASQAAGRGKAGGNTRQIGGLLFMFRKGVLYMRKRHWIWLCAIAAALISAWIAVSLLTGEKKAQPDIVARVNGSLITEEDFDRETSRIRQLYTSMGKPLQDNQLPAMKEKILESLISSELKIMLIRSLVLVEIVMGLGYMSKVCVFITLKMALCY